MLVRHCRLLGEIGGAGGAGGIGGAGDPGPPSEPLVMTCGGLWLVTLGTTTTKLQKKTGLYSRRLNINKQ